MERKKELLKAFQKGQLLNLKNTLYLSWIDKFIVDETRGDVGKKGDITSDAIIKMNKVIKAVVKTREKGIVAGIEESTFLYIKNNIKVKQIKKDGNTIRRGEILLELIGTEKDILRIERSALDLIQRMSGIATLTNELIKKIGRKIMIAPTRKTQWRYLDKKAVYIGGGLTHRLGLWDAILIKDNHLKALQREGISDVIKISLERAWKNREKGHFLEIEVGKVRDAIYAAKIIKKLQKGDKKRIPCLIMLDNMSPRLIKMTIKKMKKLKIVDTILIEASGGINPNNIKSYVNTGIDVISMGYLTHSSQALDIKQEIL